MATLDWNTGDLVWFDPGVGHWLPGEVLECHQTANVLTVQALINGKPQTFALTDGEGQVRRRQDLGAGGVEDMCQLSDLHEAALLWNLKLRYDRNLIYTYAGSILIAVNPYRMFDTSYGIESAQRYKGKLLGSLPPHLFALGAAAHAALPAPQVVVISGESGSGKTESTKLVMQYLAAVAPSAPRGQALVTEQILEAAPLLEAFGNARTAKNDNSSRFGKYLEVYFKHGAIVGARVTQYLLEKSRIVTQAPGERNYHVFYELLGSLSPSERQKYGLVDADKYFYLNQGGGDCAPGHSGSGADWGALKGAMQVLGVGEAEQEGIIKVLASVLHLGNVYFHRRQLRHGQEGVEIGSEAEIKWAAHLMQISSSNLQRALTSRVTEARAEKVLTPLGIDQALDARDAFAKALYSALFNWLVSKVNSIVQRGGLHDAARISLLDIFGFEDLAENTFEQLCINFASESLQLYFNKHIFKLEQQEYARERLEWTNLTWSDNTPVIHLLGKKPVGILHLLDDESNFPRASDASFLEKCHYNHALNENYCRPRVGGREFGIKHYAGQVWYSVDGFLDKNRDALRPDIVELLASSREPLVSAIAKPLLNQIQARTLPRGANGRFVTMKPRTPTVAARFSDSLQQLLESMSRCTPWFVRCIKPNNDKTPMRFDMPVVLQQLRYLGLLDTIHIRQAGYPIRLKFQTFVEQYRYLLPGVLPRGAPYRDLCRAILDRMPPTGTAGPDYQLGATRVFLREGLERQLELAKNDILRSSTLIIQKHIRGYLARKKYRSMKRSCVTIQKSWRGLQQRTKYRKLKRGVIKAQALYRGRRERRKYSARKAEYKRRLEAEKAAQERAKQRAARESQRATRSTVHHLEIPAELAFIFSKLENYTSPHSERNLVKVVGGITGTPPNISLPHDLDQFAFGKFSSVYFKGADFGVKREPITAPFLSKAAARDQDFQDAVALFKLILRWSNDSQMTGNRERALADYIVHKGLNSRGLRDELLVQLCNQSWKNDNADRIWQLMAHCLSCFQSSPPLSKYLLKHVTDHSSQGFNNVLQRKLLRGLQKNPHTRTYPPSLLEWRSIKQRSDMALPLTLADGTVTTVSVDSWTTCEEAAAIAVSPLGVSPEGWSVILDDNGLLSDGNGLDFVLDLVSELELCPAFPVARSELLKIGTRKVSEPEHVSPQRPQVPPPEPPQPVTRKISHENVSALPSSRKTSHETAREYSPSPQRESPRIPTTSTPTRKTSHEALSRNSALNERYFDVEKVRSRSLDNLLSGEPEPNPLANLGLSQSRLNDRYHSVEQLAPIEPVVIASSTYMAKQEIEFEYPDVSSISTSHRGGPRYIKSQYVGKKAPPGSHSSRAHIEKSELLIRSSAMSDTSEAPSLASHVRRVRVPSQASDVDQFLDELFSPVLDGNLDELSDARSLAASIKGGLNYFQHLQNPNHFLDDISSAEKFDEDLDDLVDASTLVRKIKGGGNHHFVSSIGNSTIPQGGRTEGESSSLIQQQTKYAGSGVNDFLNGFLSPTFSKDLVELTDANVLVHKIKGGGSLSESSLPFAQELKDNFIQRKIEGSKTYSQGNSVLREDEEGLIFGQQLRKDDDLDSFMSGILSPMIDEDLDDLTNTTTLLNRIKGGGKFLDQESECLISEQPPEKNGLQDKVKGGGKSANREKSAPNQEKVSYRQKVRKEDAASSNLKSFMSDVLSPVVDEDLVDLTSSTALLKRIKGGGDRSQGDSLLDDEPKRQIFNQQLEKATNVDDFIQSLLPPMVNNDLLDLTDSDSLLSKIKGGGNRNRTSSRSSSMLDQEVESLTSGQPQERPPANGDDTNSNVDDYISDLFRPIFINDSLKMLAEKHTLVDSIKGGGTTHQPGAGTSGYNFSPVSGGVVSPQPMMMPMVNSSQDSFVPMFNVQNFNLPQGTDLSAYQQNLQRAFLQSAMAQNLQIQQQLLAQNQALQQLLKQQSSVDVSESLQTVQVQIHQPPSPNRKASFKSSNFSRKSSSPSSNSVMSDFKNRKASTESNISVISRNGVNPPPPPPPMPPPLDPSDPSEVRPFMDPYGRAKTVRIGKWRWPPPKDATTAENGEDFIQFKMRQHNRKVTPSKDQSPTHQPDWEELEFEPMVREPEKLPKANSKRSFEVGANRPSPGSVGKLKLSSEMRQRLEQVTANHSVRSTSSKVDQPARTINKLEDTRKLMLEQQLAGRWDSVDGSQDAASGSPSPENLRLHMDPSKSPTQQSWNSAAWRPVPPPPPIGPQSLPPAPSVPAPPPPVRPPQPPPPVEPVRESFMAQRQDRDTFGVHQNLAIPGSSKRNSFSANWEVQSSITQETRDEVSNWAKEGMDTDKQDGRGSRQSSWEHNESSILTTSEIPHRNVSVTSNERWEMESKSYVDKTRHQAAMKNDVVERPTFRTHQMNRSAQEREKKHSVSTVTTDKPEKSEEWPEFMRPVVTPPPMAPKSPVTVPATATKLLPLGATACVTYNRVAWTLRVRKEVFTPSENLGPPSALHLMFCQIVSDVFSITPCLRLSQNERRSGLNMLSGYGVTAENITGPHRAHIKRHVVELARTWPLYFSRLFPVSGATQLSDVQLLAVSHWGVHLVKRDTGSLRVIASISLGDIASCSAPRPSTVSLEGPQSRVTLHTPRAMQLTDMVNKYCTENRKLQVKATPPKPVTTAAVTPPAVERNERVEPAPPSSSPVVMEMRNSPPKSQGSQSPGSPVPPSGKYSLLQFAMHNFRQNPELEVLKMDTSLKSKEKRKEWTWKQQTDLVKWQGTPLDGPLLRLEDPELSPLAAECFDCILRYCGDLPLDPEMSEVKCVYTVLMHCHKHILLRDEVYCQLMKQTTSNKSEAPESCQRAWRLLSIMAAYFACSETLKPFLTEHLSSAASDRRRVCHGTAAVCLANLRKTQRCGGRKNVPSVEEVTAVSAGRSARRQIYRLPGGAERVVNTRCSTVVADVIAELCSIIGVSSEAEQQEFSLYCIVQGDAFTMPLAADEYILDVTTELHKAAQPFYLIFCRSVWYHPLRHDASPLYTEVLFNQVAPDYLEGLLLKLGGPGLPPSVVRDMSLVAALLHRAADLSHVPNLKEVKFLLPKPVLGLREPRPPQWLALVQTAWGQAAGLQVSRAKHRVLQVLSTWPLFGSSFFAVKRVIGDIETWPEHILALNRNGVHFLDLNTHETLQHWPFAEVISTRKVRSEDGALFLDMKCGNLLQQRVTRLQTEQAHEISRLVRQYITLEQANIARNPSQ